MTQPKEGSAIAWREWLRRWDRQQTRYLPFREERFAAMFDALEALLPPDFVALDLGCGPGSLSQRLLERFPQARAIAVDQDPLLLAMGQGALGDIGGRLRWIDANLRELPGASVSAWNPLTWRSARRPCTGYLPRNSCALYRTGDADSP